MDLAIVKIEVLVLFNILVKRVEFAGQRYEYLVHAVQHGAYIC